MIKAVVVGCIDYRYQKLLHDIVLREKLSYGDYDFITIPGGAGNFDILEKYLTISKKLHQPNKVVLTIHEDCGAGVKLEDIKKAVLIARRVFGKYITISTHYLKL